MERETTAAGDAKYSAADKRKKPDSGDSADDSGEEAAADPAPQRKLSKALAAPDGLTGVLISCDVHKEKRAVAEALNLLEALTDQQLGLPTTSSSGAAAGETVLDELEAELAAAREARTSERRWAVVPSGVRGLLLLALRPAAPRLDPVALVLAAARSAAQSRGGTRLLQRLVPLARTCAARPDALRQLAPEVLLAGGLGRGCPPATFAVDVRSRNNDALGKHAATQAVRTLVPFPHLSAPKQPQLLVLVEVFCRAAGLAVVPASEFYRLRRFNLQELTVHGPDEPNAPAPIPPPAPATSAE